MGHKRRIMTFTNYTEAFKTRRELKTRLEDYRKRVEDYEERIQHKGISEETWLSLIRNRNWCLSQISLVKKRLRLMDETGRILGYLENI